MPAPASLRRSWRESTPNVVYSFEWSMPSAQSCSWESSPISKTQAPLHCALFNCLSYSYCSCLVRCEHVSFFTSLPLRILFTEQEIEAEGERAPSNTPPPERSLCSLFNVCQLRVWVLGLQCSDSSTVRLHEYTTQILHAFSAVDVCCTQDLVQSSFYQVWPVAPLINLSGIALRLLSINGSRQLAVFMLSSLSCNCSRKY